MVVAVVEVVEVVVEVVVLEAVVVVEEVVVIVLVVVVVVDVDVLVVVVVVVDDVVVVADGFWLLKYQAIPPSTAITITIIIAADAAREIARLALRDMMSPYNELSKQYIILHQLVAFV